MTAETQELVTPLREQTRPSDQTPNDHGAPVIQITEEVDPVSQTSVARPSEQSPNDHGAPVVTYEESIDPVGTKNRN